MKILEDNDLDACILKGMDNIFYLTGFRGSEGTLIITKGDALLITDFRYVAHAREVSRDIKVVEARGGKNVVAELCEKYEIQRLGFDSIHTTHFMYNRWLKTIAPVELVPLTSDIEKIRIQKEPGEVDAIREAIHVATLSFNQVFEKIAPGKTEKEIANELDCIMKELGAESPSFETIVASGPRGALPHATPSNKKISPGETVIIDFGARVNGYCSDETCTISVGEISGELREIFFIVNDARKLGLEKIRAGMAINELDMIVRGFVEEAGYGEYFRHGTGHGIGIAVHEAPSINTTGEGIFEEDMVVTIEPGIYLPNIGGVRLEDMVLVTGNGAQVLTSIRKDMLRVGI